MGPSVACAPNTTRWCPVTHQMSLLFMSHALSAKHRRCVRRVLAAGEKCSSHGDELLLAAAAHRGRCISTAASRCRRQYRRRQRFYVDLAVLYGSWLLLRGHLAALPAWADGPLTRQPGAHRRHPSRCHAWDSWRPTETEGSVHSNVFYESVTQCVTWACRQSLVFFGVFTGGSVFRNGPATMPLAPQSMEPREGGEMCGDALSRVCVCECVVREW